MLTMTNLIKKLTVILIFMMLLSANLLAQKGQLVFTNKEYPNFDAAKPHAISSVKDGDELWMYLKMPKALKEYAYIDDNSRQNQRTEPYYIIYALGAANDLDNEYQSDVVYFRADELNTNEIKVNLAPGIAGRHLSSNLFMGVVVGGVPGVWENGIRIYVPSKERVQTDFGSVPGKVILGEAPITVDVASGFSKYEKQMNDFVYALNKGVAGENKLGTEGRFVDNEIKAMMMSALANKNITPVKFYFTSDDWTIQRNWSTGQPEWLSVFAQAIYKKDGKCYFANIGVSRKYDPWSRQWGELSTKVDSDFPIECDAY